MMKSWLYRRRYEFLLFGFALYISVQILIIFVYNFKLEQKYAIEVNDLFHIKSNGSGQMSAALAVSELSANYTGKGKVHAADSDNITSNKAFTEEATGLSSDVSHNIVVEKALERNRTSPSTLAVKQLPIQGVQLNDTGNTEDINRTQKQELEKIDWNDYELIKRETARTGLGEQGHGYGLRYPKNEKIIKEKLFAKYNVNAYASDRISLERSIGDLRSEACRVQKFIKDIPENSVSFITVFHNEKNSTLLRTVHGLINRTPAKLLREIILVDDVSIEPELMAPLEKYIAEHFSKVTLLRNSERLGLIKSRMRGADASGGMFLVFLDAHVEVNFNFLPPLLEPMILNYKTIACPMIDQTNPETFKIFPIYGRNRGAFDWDLGYKRIPLNWEDATTPHPSPAMVGCAFAITRRWWEELGKYDPGLEIWGAEQYELSFKSWQCGGRVVDAPCSRVAHVFRPLPYVKEVTHDNIIERNYLRLASVWMDEYKEFILQRRPLMREEEPGDISQQLELRKRLNCKPFKWFMEEVAPDILEHYPVRVPPSAAWGMIKSRSNSSLCVTAKNNHDLFLERCARSKSSEFVLNWRTRIRYFKDNYCFAHTGKKYVFMWECIDVERWVTQSFGWNQSNGHIVALNTGYCLDVEKTSRPLIMAKCDESRTTQGWQFESFNATLAAGYWDRFIGKKQ